jgi:hypothetical protein
VESARAILRAAQAALGKQFRTDFSVRAPFSALHPSFLTAMRACSEWPEPTAYDALASCVPQPPGVELPRFVAQDREALRRFGGYEAHVRGARAVPTRRHSWHDFFNMAVWAHFPRVRWSLNALHVDDTLGPKDPRNGRTPPQNVAAQFDESGVVIASSDPEILQQLRALRFKQVFWERRAELLASTRFWIVGHGTLESLLTPHLGLASKAVLLQISRPPSSFHEDELRHQLDARVAAEIEGWRRAVPTLDPLPLLGVPGYADNSAPEFYDDARYFRFQRVSGLQDTRPL